MRSSDRRGFTLIELLAVLAILAILAVFLLPRLSKAGEAAEERMTAAFLQQLEAAIVEYEQQVGDWPASRWLEDWGPAPNTINLGAETLVVSLWSRMGGAGLPEDRLVNTDADESRKALASFPKPSLFELRDQWQNPIAYFHRRDYGRTDTYLVVDLEGAGYRESSVTARKNPVTGGWYNPNGHQLLSAGLDGEFGTDDDIGNFHKPKD